MGTVQERLDDLQHPVFDYSAADRGGAAPSNVPPYDMRAATWHWSRERERCMRVRLHAIQEGNATIARDVALHLNRSERPVRRRRWMGPAYTTGDDLAQRISDGWLSQPFSSE
jgi:hypothetical protein